MFFLKSNLMIILAKQKPDFFKEILTPWKFQGTGGRTDVSNGETEQQSGPGSTGGGSREDQGSHEANEFSCEKVDGCRWNFHRIFDEGQSCFIWKMIFLMMILD